MFGPAERRAATALPTEGARAATGTDPGPAVRVVGGTPRGGDAAERGAAALRGGEDAACTLRDVGTLAPRV